MMRKTFGALFLLATVSLIQPTLAFARGGGGGHGGVFGRGGFHGRAFHGGFADVVFVEEDFADVGLEDMALGSITRDTILTPTTWSVDA